MKFVKKFVKWSVIGGVLGATYGAGRMNPKRQAGRFENMLLRKGKK